MSEIKALEELRKYVSDWWAPDEAVNKDVNRFADEIQAEVDERFMELPLDADGVPIRVGDMLLRSTGAPKESYGEVVGVSDDSVFFNDKSGGWVTNWASLTRHKSRTLEDVLDDFSKSLGCKSIFTDMKREAISKYAAEIRELLGVDA